MNRNTLYAQILVDELARSGLQHVCLAPGSRNTPLVLAFAQHGAIKVHSHLDERSAAFYALGLALASDRPVALVCTSGTAAANFFPAVIEAHQSAVPLLVLTADRPPELRHSGANQTIDQLKLYGDYALWFVDAALPEAHPPAVALRNLRTLANRAYATANGVRKGVVQVNVPFRSPLEPTPIAEDVLEIPPSAAAREGATPFTTFVQSAATYLPESTLQGIAQIISRHERGWIVCGANTPRGAFSAAVVEFSKKIGYPILAEPSSGVRFGYDATARMVIGGYDTFLNGKVSLAKPSVILRFGNLPTSKWLNQYLDQAQPDYDVHIHKNGMWADDAHRLTHFIQADEVDFCEQIGELTFSTRYGHNDWKAAITQLEKTTWAVLDEGLAAGALFDGQIVADVVRLIPTESTLFVGNSLPVRHLDQFGKPSEKRLHIFANRGASGIDGNLSTALGAGAARPDHPLVAIVGDVTFYHDMNGLLAIKRCGVPITIVLLNNNGGGIFYRLPVKDYDPAFTDLFVTPHGLDFSHAAHLYGVDYVQTTDRATFQQAFQQSVTERRSTIIEVRTDAQTDFARRNALVKAVQQALAGS